MKAGVYHFFEKLENGDIKSLYVGKGSFSPPNETYKNGWNLYERLKQHFQERYKFGLLSKASKKSGGQLTPTQIKNNFNGSEIYLQWLTLYSKQPNNLILDSATCERQKREIIFCEHFCISMLHPEFNDG